MRFRLRRFFGASVLFLLVGGYMAGCSSADQGQQELESEYSQQQGQEYAEEGQEGEEGQGYGEQQGEYAEGQEGQGYADQEGEGYAEGQEGQGYAETTNDYAGGDNYGDTGDDALSNNVVEDGLSELVADINEANAEGYANNAYGDTANAAPTNDATAEYAAPAADATAEYAPPAADSAPTASGGGFVGGMAGTPAGPGLPEVGSKMPYVVRKGDSLAKIATKIYGNMERWREIATLSNLDNPSLIYPGDVVYYQLTDESLPFAQAYENLPKQEITVNVGDTLAGLAQQVYGSSNLWMYIWRQNDNINDPDRLVEGQVIYYVAEATFSAFLDDVKSMRMAMQSQTSGKGQHMAELKEKCGAKSKGKSTQLSLEQMFYLVSVA